MPKVEFLKDSVNTVITEFHIVKHGGINGQIVCLINGINKRRIVIIIFKIVGLKNSFIFISD